MNVFFDATPDYSSLRGIPLSGFTPEEEKLLIKVLDKAPSILGVDPLTIKNALNNLDNQKKIKEAFSSSLPGSPPIHEEDIDDLPPIVAGMTIREIVLLGTLATVLKVTDALEDACIRSNQIESGSFREWISIDAHRQLHVQKFGTPSPHHRCVIMESGGGTGGDSWGKVKELIEDSSYGFSYDRAGLWLFSDQSPNTGRLSQISQDFESMVTKLEEKGDIKSPYILVGHSLGGIFMQFYALNHPDKVAGLILVDSSNDTVAEDPRMAPSFNVPEAHDFHVLNHLMPRSTAEQLFPRARHTLTAYTEAVHKRETLSHFGQSVKKHAEPVFGNTPLCVITRVKTDTSEIEEAWQEHQQQLAQRSSNSSVTICKKGVGHDIPNEAPEKVAQAILSMS